MGHGDNQYLAFLFVIDKTVGKPAQEAAPAALAKRMPSVREAANAIDSRDGL